MREQARSLASYLDHQFPCATHLEFRRLYFALTNKNAERDNAIEEQHKRDEYLAKYHHYEFASAAFQIGIVLASSTVITGIIALSFMAAGLGVIGLAFMAIGLFAPHAVHLL